MKPTGRRLSILLILIGLAVIAGTGIALKESIRDRWYLWKLEHATSSADRAKYILTLIERRCGAVTPHLLQFHRDHPYQGSIGTALGYHRHVVERIASIGPTAVPWLAAALEPPEDLTQAMVLDALKELGPSSAPALQTLVRYIQRKDQRNLGEALGALSAIGRGAQADLPALLELASQPNSHLRWSLYNILRDIGPPAALPGIPLLLEALTMGGDEDLLAATMALDRLDPDAGIEKCLPLASGESPESRRTAATALGGFRSRTEVAVPTLLKLTEDGDGQVVLRAVRSLGSLEGGAVKAIPRLIEICKKPGTHEIFEEALMSLGEIGIASPEILRLFTQVLPRSEAEATDDLHATLTFQWLARKAENTPKVLDALLNALRDEGGPRWGAMKALPWIGPIARGALEDLSKIAAGEGEMAELAKETIQRIESFQDADGQDEGDVWIFHDPLEDAANRR